MASKRTSVVIIGAGNFARHHAECTVKMGKGVRLAGFVEPSEASRQQMREWYASLGEREVPPFFTTLKEFLAANAGPADCAVIVVPHSLHVSYIVECMMAGMDVLVEKPMVLDCAEARRVIRVRNRTGRLLSVAFPGSFSPGIRKVKDMVAAGEIGAIRAIVGYCHQNWHSLVEPHSWKRNPAISGGGFLFDTGSHLVNTMVDLGGADVKALSVMQDNSVALELSTAMMGRFANGIFFTLAAEGDSVNCQSRIVLIGTKGVLTTSMYGDLLRIIRPGCFLEQDVPVPPSLGVFEQFLRVREGTLENPCPAEVGLRFAKLMDLVRSAIGKSENAGKRSNPKSRGALP